jgi:nucleotide-binding universal stress UspA family protein
VSKNLTGTRFFLQKGDAAERILHVAGSESVDLIVIGSRSVGRLEALVLGSVGRKVANDAKCHVLIVR